MENKSFNIPMEKNPSISINLIPGHFTTSNYHLNYYLDLSSLKFNAAIAKIVARELAIPYLTNTMVDNIVCMEKTEVIGAYLAEELITEGVNVINSDSDIHVLTPEYNTQGKLIFQDNVNEWIAGSEIILLVSTISNGWTVKEGLECISYYGGNTVGVSSLFEILPHKLDIMSNTLFTSDDIPDFKIYSTNDCEFCKKGRKLDALINSDGYTRL